MSNDEPTDSLVPGPAKIKFTGPAGTPPTLPEGVTVLPKMVEYSVPYGKVCGLAETVMASLVGVETWTTTLFVLYSESDVLT